MLDTIFFEHVFIAARYNITHKKKRKKRYKNHTENEQNTRN